MTSMMLLLAIGEINEELIYAARRPFKTIKTQSVLKKRRILIAVAIIGSLLLCGYVAYQSGMIDLWFQKPSNSPVETVESAIEGQLRKEYTLAVEINEIKVDDDATARARKLYQGSDLAKKEGWSDKYIEDNMIVIYAEYHVEYDHEKTFQPDGEIKHFFILVRDEDKEEWVIWNTTTSSDPFM